MSDTPETDAALYPMNQVDIVWPDFARKLERERDEARKHLKEIEEYGTEEINAAIDLRRNLAQALVDLDDTQYQRDFSRRNHALAVESMSAWKERAEKAERERDEARKSLDEMSKYLAQATAQRDHAETELRKWMAFVKGGAK